MPRSSEPIDRIAIADAIDTLRDVRWLVAVRRADRAEAQPAIMEVFAESEKKALSGAKARLTSLYGRKYAHHECTYEVSQPWWSVNTFRTRPNF